MAEFKFILDGKEVTAQPGETILAVAARNGIEIPTLCFNKKISKTTSCFVCVVKDVKTGKFLPSCSACPAPGQEIESSTDEVREMRRTALGLLLSEHTGDCEAPCTLACPAHANVEEYVRAGRKGDFLESLKIIKQRIPLPMSVGRVCPRFCEKDCRRNIDGKPVSINDVKRIAADLFYETYMEELPELNGKKVAIIGAGPAGLSAAYYLRLQGVASVLFDQQPEAGGMLRYGIPEFRLPKDTLRKELAHFGKMGGIEIRTNSKLDRDFTLDQLKSEYDAVIFAIGSWASSSMRIDGEDLANQGIAWLGEIAGKNWQGCANPGRTVVVGGGNTAMDCARTALRLGGDVTVVYRRTKNEMPASLVEIEEAEEEGIKFEYLTAPLALAKAEDGSLALSCQRMELGAADASGRRTPVPVAGSDFIIPADTVISAIGQRTIVPAGIPSGKRGIEAAKEDLRVFADTPVYAAGDCVSGPATVVEALAAGRKAVLAVLDFFAGKPHTDPFLFNVSRGHWRNLAKEDLVYLRKISEADRVQPDYISMDRRKSTFDELFDSIPADKVSAEADRCIECSCTAKGDCLLKKHSTKYGVSPDMYCGQKPISTVDVRHEYIIHDKQKCIRCGTCVKVCSEVINKGLLALMKRGFNTMVQTALGEELPSYCKDCGACVNECPVGALDWKQKK
ncbi:MAG: FAD-dependent oxidoreductase [Lentisphaeria bacterium]|nr:FAD-dependent oxidoreductase [Lentisphaeria bacterium]